MEFKQLAEFRIQGSALKKLCIVLSVGVGVVLFFFAYSFVSFESASDTTVRLNSPDETSNYFFSRLYATTGELKYTEPLLGITEHFLHPRSMTGVAGYVVPVSFVGMPLFYGTVGQVFGIPTLLFLTPLIATIIPFLFYRFLKALFSRRVAIISALLLVVHPAYWYFANRAMMHNIIFFGLLVAGFAVFSYIRLPSERGIRSQASSYALFLLAGLCIGASLMVRMSEVVWVAPLMVFVAFLFARYLSLRAILAFLCGVAIPASMFFTLNANLYGSPASFGYHGYEKFDASKTVSVLQQGAASMFSGGLVAIDAFLVSVNESYQSLSKYILPFGYEPEIFSQNFFQYFATLFWWLVLPIAIGLLILIRNGFYALFKARDIRPLAYIVYGSIICFWMVAYYGSWVVQDNITNIPTIGNSYIRYWLILYALALPGVASLLVFLFDRAKWASLQRLGIIGIVAVLVFFSFDAVVLNSNESLVAVRDSIRFSREKWYQVKELTQNNSVIISQRSDKIFFPDRRVMESIKDFQEAVFIPRLLSAGVPVYYYGLWNRPAADTISRRYLAPFGIHLEYIATVGGGESLFAVRKN